MPEDHDVTQIGEHWGRMLHRKIQIVRCENGYVVKYTTVSEKGESKQEDYLRTVERTRVFITNSDLFEFLEKYFDTEPKP